MDPDEERVLQLLTDERNRRILSVIEAADGPMALTALAEELLQDELTVTDADAYERAVDRLCASLHHHRLPALDEAGILEYDHRDCVVAKRPHDRQDPEWMQLDTVADLLERTQPRASGDEFEIGVIEEGAEIYRYGRRLADRADSELFLIYASDTLLDTDCVPAASDAVERGVDFSVGTRDPAARQFFSEHFPEATIWEPQWDLMNDPNSFPRVERLIFADRNQLLIGIVDERDGEPVETALIGEGNSNPLVVLARELLGSRLDHLDYQSETFLERLPFD